MMSHAQNSWPAFVLAACLKAFGPRQRNRARHCINVGDGEQEACTTSALVSGIAPACPWHAHAVGHEINCTG